MSLVCRTAALVAASWLMAAPSFAGQLKVERSVTVAANAAKTWDTVKDFGELQTWHPAVEKTDIKKGGDNKVGTVRVLALKGGGTITETLTKFSPAGRSFSYRIEDSPLPVESYVSTLNVKPAKAGHARVTWGSTFRAKKGSSDAEAKKVIEGIYDAGFGNLQKMLGG